MEAGKWPRNLACLISWEEAVRVGIRLIRSVPLAGPGPLARKVAQAIGGSDMLNCVMQVAVEWILLVFERRRFCPAFKAIYSLSFASSINPHPLQS